MTTSTAKPTGAPPGTIMQIPDGIAGIVATGGTLSSEPDIVFETDDGGQGIPRPDEPTYVARKPTGAGTGGPIHPTTADRLGLLAV